MAVTVAMTVTMFMLFMFTMFPLFLFVLPFLLFMLAFMLPFFLFLFPLFFGQPGRHATMAGRKSAMSWRHTIITFMTMTGRDKLRFNIDRRALNNCGATGDLTNLYAGNPL